MPRRSVRRKRTRKHMKKRKCPCKKKCTCKKNMRKRKTKRRKSRKGKSRRRRKRRVSLKVNERINMKKIQSGGSLKGIMRGFGLGDITLAGSGLVNSIKGGYQTYIGGDDFESASPINQKLESEIHGGVVPDVPGKMAEAAQKLQ